MAHGVVRVGLEHRGQVALLEHPDAVVVEQLGDLVDEGLGPLEVVEHRDRGDDLGAAPGIGLAHQLRAEEIRNQPHMRRVVLLELRPRRVDADQRQGFRVGLEQRAVVRADVHHQVGVAQLDQGADARHLRVQVLDHRLVEARAVAIVVAVEAAEIVVVAQLHQVAARAFCKPQRPRRHVLRPRLGEHAGQRLLAEVHHVAQFPRQAQPAVRDLSIEHAFSPSAIV